MCLITNLYCYHKTIDFLAGIFAYFALRRSHCAAESPDGATAGSRRDDLPDIRRKDIERHKDASTGVWMTYRDGVYDVTDYVAGHPGGDETILLAAGGRIDGYWHCYTVHHKAEVYETLELLRIGNVHPDDVIASVPFEPPTTVDSVTVDGVGVQKPVDLSIDEMKTRFKAVTVTTKGDAVWTGVRLSDVLTYAGVRENDVELVAFHGGDSNAEGKPYEKSIPAATAFDPKEDVLLAFVLNGEPLNEKNGAPCRLVIPSASKARHVKWLQRVTVVARGSA